MANENLRQALRDAGLQPDELADILLVGQRTMRRWLAGGVPYARYRAKLARALDRPEHELWPELAEQARPADTASPAPVPDTIHAYHDPDAPGAPSVEALIKGAGEQIDLLAHASRDLLGYPGIPELLRSKAAAGCRVRIMITAPDREVLPSLLAVPRIEVRLGDVDQAPYCERIDDQIVTWLNLRTRNPVSVLLHATQSSAPGWFSLLTDGFQTVWELATSIQTADDIDEYFNDGNREQRDPPGTETEAHDQHEAGNGDGDDSDAATGQTPAPPSKPMQPAASAAPSTGLAPRRWPGRPS